jgi:hypothetical protein
MHESRGAATYFGEVIDRQSPPDGAAQIAAVVASDLRYRVRTGIID